MHQTFHYDTSFLAFEKDTTKIGVFEKIVWQGSYTNCEEASQLGLPELPIFHQSLKLSSNIIIDSINVSLHQGTSGVLEAPIRPRQYPTPIGDNLIERPFAINNDTYLTPEEVPYKNLQNYSIEQTREGRFLYLEIIPFRYNPVTNEYTAYSIAEVDVYSHEDEKRESVGLRLNIGLPYYEYTIITSSQLISAFEPFARWKRAKGYNVGIVDINDILSNVYLTGGDGLSSISDDAGKLRQYLIYSYNEINTKYVLLGGDSTIIPIRYAATDNIPSDFYYSELNSNWDANGNGIYGEDRDNIDYGAEVYVGRLLCNTINEVENWTQKVLQYEINPGDGNYSYLGRALISQADQMQNYHQAEYIQQKLQGNISCTIFSESPDANSSAPTASLGASIISAINTTHYGLLSNFNHGKPLSYGTATPGLNDYGHRVQSAVAAMDSYDEDDLLLYAAIPEANNGFDNLTNQLFPSIMYSTSCTNMPFDQYNTPPGTYNLGRVFTCRSNGGGPAYLGNTRNGWVDTSFSLYNLFLDSILVSDHNNHLGVAESKSKLSSHSNYLLHSHNILGCPEMSLYTHTPDVFNNIIVSTANNHIAISTGTDSIEMRICLSGDINGIYKQFVYTERSNVIFDTIPELYTIVVSKPNYIPCIITNNTCYLQNEIISDNRTYVGCNIFNIGSNISSLKPYGNVTIENGGDVTINVGEKVIIKNNFEVKQGGKLKIQ